MPPDPHNAEVKAAGGVVWRRADDGGVELALVHRPRYDDWSLPKGKLDPGENCRTRALREVAGGGRRARHARRRSCAGRLPRQQGPAKVVRYWLMEATRRRDVRAQRRGRRGALGGARGRARPLADLRARRERRSRRRSSGSAREPRALPGARGRLGAARRPGRHADGRRRHRRDGRRSCARATTPTTAACSRPRARPTRWSRRRAPRSRGCSAPSRPASSSARA